MMKISKLELLTLLLAAVFLAFTAGWFLGGSRQAEGVRVETQRTLRQAEPIGAPAPSPSEQTPAPTELININTADAQTLQQLPGIGEKRAQDLTKVDGIGEGTLQGLIDRITTGEEPQ